MAKRVCRLYPLPPPPLLWHRTPSGHTWGMVEETANRISGTTLYWTNIPGVAWGLSPKDGGFVATIQYHPLWKRWCAKIDGDPKSFAKIDEAKRFVTEVLREFGAIIPFDREPDYSTRSPR